MSELTDYKAGSWGLDAGERFDIVEDASGAAGAALTKDLTLLADRALVHHATRDPLSSDHKQAGFYVGSRWINTSTSKTFLCIQSSDSSAVWRELVFAEGAQTLSGAKSFSAGLKVPADNAKAYLGAEDDASLYYDGTNLCINPKEVGSGSLVVLGFLGSSQTVDQETTASVVGSQTAEVLQDGSASTGTDEALERTYEAVKFHATGAHNTRAFSLRMKVIGTLTNPTAIVYGYLYSNNPSTNVPQTQLGSVIGAMRIGSITSSYAEYLFSVSTTLAADTDYWLVLRLQATPAGGTIYLDSANSGSGEHAYSADGTSWTLENGKKLWLKLLGRTSYGLSGFSTNNAGVYGASINGYGVYGYSVNSLGVYGRSINSTAVYGSTDIGTGITGQATQNGTGVYGLSVTGYGLYGEASSSGDGLFGKSSTGRSLYVYRDSGSATKPMAYFYQDHASDAQTVLKIRGDGSGDLVNVFDGDDSTEVFTILDGGNVGLGQASPTHRLELASGTTVAAGMAQGDCELYRSAADTWKTPDTFDALAFKANGTSGASGSFTTNDGKTVTVSGGIITSIV